MKKANCWEVMDCGREGGGRNVAERGVCPAARPGAHSGVNGGQDGGRICWAVAGTLCGGEVQADVAQKRATCLECEVFADVRRDEGALFHLAPPHPAHRPLIDQFSAIMSIIDSLNAVVYVADLETHELLFVNAYTEQLFGPDIMGRPCWSGLQSEQTGPCAFCTNHRLVVDGRPAPPVVWEFQNTVTRRWFLCIDKAIPWWDGRLVRMEVAIDITDRKAADEFRDQYVGLVSHDLRNPLNGILLHAQVLRRSLQARGTADETESIETVISSAKRMNAMIDDLLETTRLESGKIELRTLSVDLREWAANALGLVSTGDRGRVELVRSTAPLVVLADASRLDRVLENLLSNALKYSAEGPVTVTARREGDEAIVSVKDEGRGIAAEDLPRVFDRFYRARTAGQVHGLGLGLYTARLIVEAHGGRVWVESEVGRGSTFHFAIPLAKQRG